MNEFNYKDSLNGIKASLFDIYEDQEQEIGLEQNPEKRRDRLNKFIEVKDIALTLIEAIHALYEEKDISTSIIKNKLENPKIPSKTEESKILDMVENSAIEDQVIKEIDKENEASSDFNEEVANEDIEDNYEEPKEEIVFESQEENPEREENSEKKEVKINPSKKYYLDCDIKNINFAYVPQSLYEKIRNFHSNSLSEYNIDNNSSIEVKPEDKEEELESIRYMKHDNEKPRGIIVRSDQYMKLALSKHRQEGVLKEARKYRIEEVKRKRKEEQKRELEKAEVKIDI